MILFVAFALFVGLVLAGRSSAPMRGGCTILDPPTIPRPPAPSAQWTSDIARDLAAAMRAAEDFADAIAKGDKVAAYEALERLRRVYPPPPKEGKP